MQLSFQLRILGYLKSQITDSNSPSLTSECPSCCSNPSDPLPFKLSLCPAPPLSASHPGTPNLLCPSWCCCALAGDTPWFTCTADEDEGHLHIQVLYPDPPLLLCDTSCSSFLLMWELVVHMPTRWVTLMIDNSHTALQACSPPEFCVSSWVSLCTWTTRWS